MSYAQVVGETEQAKCSYAIANGLTNILGKLSGCQPPPPGKHVSLYGTIWAAITVNDDSGNC
jgi:hypothetical protein